MTLRAARVNAGLDQKLAAKCLKISNKTLCAWEAGKSYPKADKIKEICELYSIDFDDLIFLTDKPLLAVERNTKNKQSAKLSRITCFERG